MLKVPSFPDLLKIAPDIASESRDFWSEKTLELRKLNRGRGAHSKAFENCCRKLLECAYRAPAEIRNDLERPIDLRACTTLWLNAPKFLKRVPVNERTLSRFREIKPRQNFVVFSNLISLLFNRYDTAGDVSALKKFVDSEFDLVNPNILNSQLQKLKESRSILFSAEAEKLVSGEAVSTGRSLTNTLRSLGIEPALEGRFSDLCKAHHYLTRLRSLDPGKDNSKLLEEVTTDGLKNNIFEGRLFGHAVVDTIIERVKEGSFTIPQEWLDTLLSIAGDPRVSTTSSNYQKWWSQIKSANTQAVVSWLGNFDLKLFLDILEESSKRSGDEALERMFPSRHKFMDGLRKQGKVHGARLFLSKEAEYFLRASRQGKSMPAFANLDDHRTSVILLKLDSGTLVEGTHSFKLRYYDRMPKDSRVESPEYTSFYLYQFRNTLPNSYERQFGVRPFEVIHHQNWEHKAIKHLRSQGILLDIESMLTRDSYRRFKQNYGV